MIRLLKERQKLIRIRELLYAFGLTDELPFANIVRLSKMPINEVGGEEE